MKRSFLIVMMFSLIMITNVHATTFSDFLPGGKNYIDPANFEYNEPTLANTDPIKVKANTAYTFSMPGDDLISLVEISIYSFSETYLSGSLNELTNCTSSNSFSQCTFTTSNDEYINIEIEGRDLAIYIDYYNVDLFQIEEGTTRTVFEEYIEPFNDSTSPEFSGAGAYVMAYYESTTLQEIIDNHIVVIDDIDGDVSASIEVISDDFTGHLHQIGEYLVSLRATDTSGNMSYFNLTVIIKDESIPTIDGPDSVTVNVNNESSIEEIILSNYTASDGYDGSLFVSYSLDDYTANKTILGSYLITLSATDNSNNNITKNITINVVDVDAPIINNGPTIDVFLSDTKTINEVITLLGVTDNYDLYDELVFGANNNTYTGSESIVGTYTFDLVVIDTSNNILSSQIVINVIDDIDPSIQGPNIYSISYTEELSINDILNLLTVQDNYDTLTVNDLVVITDTFTSRTEEIGNFTIEFELADSNNNKTTFSMTINIIDDVSPIIYIDNYLISLSGNVVFTEQDALLMLVNNRELPNENYQITTIVNEYSGNEKTPGTYQYSLQFTNEDGNAYQKDFMIKVPSNDVQTNPWLIVRNVAFYSLTITVCIFTVKKSKK